MKTVYICLMALAALAAATSCVRNDMPKDVGGPIDVRLVVNDVNGTRVGSDNTDNVIHQLRVYAFIGDEKVGYAVADDLNGQNYIPMTLSRIGDINFYVIANDKFGPDPKKHDGTAVTDWESLTRTELETLEFDLTGFDGWQQINGDFASPMSNNPCDEFGVEFTGKNENNYTASYTINLQDLPSYGSLVIPVTVQHVLGRLRLMLNKESDDVTVTLTRTEVYHRPDAFRLHNSGNDAITYHNNDETLVDILIDESIPAQHVELGLRTTGQITQNAYTTVARTYLAPNLYGSSDPDTYTAQKSDETTATNGLDETYRLELTVRFDYQDGATELKTYRVYLPQVPRNTSIDVQGTFNGSPAVTPEFNVMTETWVEKSITIPPFI